MITPELSRRLARLKDTKYFRSKELEYFMKIVYEAEEVEEFSRLSTVYQNDIIEAEEELRKLQRTSNE